MLRKSTSHRLFDEFYLAKNSIKINLCNIIDKEIRTIVNSNSKDIAIVLLINVKI